MPDSFLDTCMLTHTHTHTHTSQYDWPKIKFKHTYDTYFQSTTNNIYYFGKPFCPLFLPILWYFSTCPQWVLPIQMMGGRLHRSLGLYIQPWSCPHNKSSLLITFCPTVRLLTLVILRSTRPKVKQFLITNPLSKCTLNNNPSFKVQLSTRQEFPGLYNYCKKSHLW